MELFDSYLTRNVFETSVENVPPLIPLFKAFEKQKKKHLIKGFNASDFDESCQSYYEDSAMVKMMRWDSKWLLNFSRKGEGNGRRQRPDPGAVRTLLLPDLRQNVALLC
ncbi:hypothetical protein A3770_16p76670 [Chloropicon primus]|uniref:Uncharacterized protein n=1 Tax=Chloropicon primus TaxID=1764295 RepID=A0A5B8MX31_9CHLO|nr:hypothetical protein A3770_16p76670 [Chloropicon primus]|eukprot:QDZ25149.1 hypothetical protein A3770_16p76670 [Chloropicon primus]